MDATFEAIVASLLEKTLVGGAFIYMLHYFLTKFSKTLETISSHMSQISETLFRINVRLDNVEERLDKLEGVIKHEQHE